MMYLVKMDLVRFSLVFFHADVTKMELHLDEIAELRDAIERWLVAR